MKPLKVIKDPEAFELLGDPTRRKMIFLLRVKEMTVSQMAEDLKLTPQAVYHHIKKLLKGGIIEVVREVRIDHLIESYYMATAETFHFSVGTTVQGKKATKEKMVEALNALKRIGFKVDYDDKILNQLVEIEVEMEDCCKSGKFEEKLAELDDLDILTKETIAEYADQLAMSDKEFTKELELKEKFRKILQSVVER